MSRLKAYVANPLIFSPATREWYKGTMIPVVEKHVDVINLPTSSGGAKMDESMSKRERSKAIFDWNVKRLDQCDFVICVLDGVQTDDGTAWEVGYAWAKGKPSIGVRFDMRDGCKEKVSRFTNLMIENCCVDIVTSLEELDAVLANYVAEHEAH